MTTHSLPPMALPPMALPRMALQRMSLLPLALLAAAAAAPPDPMAGTIDAASRAFDDMQFRRDRAALEAATAPTLGYVRGSGALADRAAFLAAALDPGPVYAPFRITGRRIVPIGTDGAVVTAQALIRGTDGGRPFATCFRFADTFERHGGRWRAVFVQVTPIAPAACSSLPS